MAAARTWYYQSESGVVGPIASAELKRLIDLGVVRPNTRIRRGEEGSWIPAEGIQVELGPAGSGETKAAPAADPAEWYFTRQDKRKLGPVSRTMLETMLSQGKLQPADLVWKAGMAGWVPASEVPGLVPPSAPMPAAVVEKPIAPLPTVGIEQPIAPLPTVGIGKPGGPPPPVGSRTAQPVSPRGWQNDWRILAGGAAAGTVLLSVIAASSWVWLRTGPGATAVPRERQDRTKSSVVGRTPARSSGAPAPPAIPPADDVERLYNDAIAALRRGQHRRARTLLDRYVIRPEAAKAEAARNVIREIDLASSADEAGELARQLNNEELRGYLRTGVGPLVASAVQTAELRPLYSQTLLQAFRQEGNRRQLPQLEKGAPVVKAPSPGRRKNAGAPDSNLATKRSKSAPVGPNSRFGSAATSKQAPAPDRSPMPTDGSVSSSSVTLDALLDAPGKFEGKTLRVNGLYKIGTRFSQVKGPDGNPVGWSIPVDTNDGVTICSGETKVRGRDTYLLLDEPFARFVNRIFKQLKIHTTLKPIHKCLVTVAVRSLMINQKNAPVAHIVGLEILGAYDPLKVINNQYDTAFLVAQITPDNASVNHGNGALWVERLGGEEKFVLPARRKYKELVRKIVAERDQAIMARYLNSQLSSVMTMGAAAQQRQAQAFRSLIGQVLLR